jgi:cytochrome P450
VSAVESRALYYDPYDYEIDVDPYPVFKRLRDEAPLYRNDKHDFWALSRFDDVKAAATDWRTYSSAKGTVLEIIKSGIKFPRGTILFEDPPIHGVHRKLISRMFSPRRIAALEPAIRAACVAALEPHVGTGRFDFVEHLGADLPMGVIGMLLGIPDQFMVQLRDRAETGMRKAALGERSQQFGASSQLVEYVHWRLRHPGKDIITQLSRAVFIDERGVERTLTEDELINYVWLLGAAGSDTTTRLIGSAGYCLAKHPEQRARLAEDPSLIPGAIEELLRYESPSPVQARHVTRDVELHGETVPAGAVMLLLTAAANRDERVFDDPDRFDVTRAGDRHIAFGHGIHFCLGNALARLEGRVALEEILARFPAWELDEANLERFHTSTVRGWHRVPVLT